MKPVEIPTDNLYKFMAIGGLVTFLASAVATGLLMLNLQDRVHEHILASKLLDVRLNQIAVESEIVRFEFEEAAKAGDLASIGERPKAQLDSVAAVLRELKLDATKLQAQSEYLVELSRRFVAARDLLIIFTGVGLVVAVFGFVLWYSRVQRYLDAQLKEPHAASASGVDESPGQKQGEEDA